ncbi:Heparanase [Operophtera brumata]|uniref:Heparanase n=1 Tax=Operophtera brumata TaxID=104452 RepID=A0A0L7L2M8_OPEBR|nr:Heparanase [Operophtera brumata]
MHRIIIVAIFLKIVAVSADTYSVKIGAEQHVNVVDSRFMSFTIDPNKECICMASSLTPAYIRIAGPSTALMSYHNSSITIDEDMEPFQPKRSRFQSKFIQWAKSSGFDLVFALNNEEKMKSGMWDPNMALNILTYLNDLETLRVITETFPLGRSGTWKVVGGDVARCLHEDSKSDFKDYVTLNSSTAELDRMSERDRLKLLKHLSHSTAPLWLTERPWIEGPLTEMSRAADWLTSLGHAARNGFSSFYMALLFKNLVGEKVLNVDMQPEQAIINIVVNGRAMYHEGDLKPIVKRVRPYKTLLINLPAKSFGFWVLANTKIDACFTPEKYNETENIDEVSISEEPEIQDLKTKRSINVEDYEEYINSADISVDFCDENEVTENLNKDLSNRANDIKNNLSEALFKVKTKQEVRTKRQTDNNNPKEKIRKFIQHGLKNRNIKSEPDLKPRGLIGNFLQTTKHNITRLFKGNRLHNFRQLPLFNRNKLKKRQSDSKPMKTLNKHNENYLVSKESIGKKQTMKIRKAKAPQQYKNNNVEINKLEKDSAEDFMRNKANNQDIPKQNNNTNEQSTKVAKDSIEEKVRTRRNTKDQVEMPAENEIDIKEDKVKLWKMLRKMHKQFKDLSDETDEYVDDIDTEKDYSKGLTDTLIDNGKDDNVVLGDDDTTFIKSTVYNLMRVISDLNKNLNRFWNRMSLLD